MPIDPKKLEDIRKTTRAEQITWGVLNARQNAPLIHGCIQHQSGPVPDLSELFTGERVLMEAVRFSARFANFALDVIDEISDEGFDEGIGK